ncbi:MAG: hypothetical protein AAF799_00655 [Myxococcota bacterium]
MTHRQSPTKSEASLSAGEVLGAALVLALVGWGVTRAATWMSGQALPLWASLKLAAAYAGLGLLGLLLAAFFLDGLRLGWLHLLRGARIRRAWSRCPVPSHQSLRPGQTLSVIEHWAAETFIDLAEAGYGFSRELKRADFLEMRSLVMGQVPQDPGQRLRLQTDVVAPLFAKLAGADEAATNLVSLASDQRPHRRAFFIGMRLLSMLSFGLLGWSPLRSYKRIDEELLRRDPQALERLVLERPLLLTAIDKILGGPRQKTAPHPAQGQREGEGDPKDSPRSAAPPGPLNSSATDPQATDSSPDPEGQPEVLAGNAGQQGSEQAHAKEVATRQALDAVNLAKSLLGDGQDPAWDEPEPLLQSMQGALGEALLLTEQEAEHHQLLHRVEGMQARLESYEGWKTRCLALPDPGTWPPLLGQVMAGLADVPGWELPRRLDRGLCHAYLSCEDASKLLFPRSDVPPQASTTTAATDQLPSPDPMPGGQADEDVSPGSSEKLSFLRPPPDEAARYGL